MKKEKRTPLLPPLLLLLSFFLAAVSACDPSDRTALQDFSGQIVSESIDGWNFNDSSADCCGWSGITCEVSSERRVEKLDLSGRGIKGKISASLSNLISLRSLNLSNNDFEGAVPAELFRFLRLEELDLSVNALSGVTTAISSLPSLRVYNISFNRFNGRHPVFKDSANLTVFDVGDNEFTGRVDADAICQISKKIRVLRFSRNQFDRSLPSSLANCGSLIELHMDSTKITGQLPDDLFEIISLKRLYVQNNNLYGDANKFRSLSNLEELDFSFNGFSGSLPDMFGNLTKLRYFSAAKNQFTGNLPSSLSLLSSIEELNLQGNSFTGEINLDFSRLPNLTSIDLGSNRLNGAIPPTFNRSRNLKSLNLARNFLKGEIPQSFRSIKSLTHLSLSNNSLTNLASALDVLQLNPRLSNLVLTMNFFGEKLPSDGIQGFRNLTLLVIANCELSGAVPQWLSNCSQLKLIDLSWNKLEGAIPPFFGDMNFLFYLDLSNNTLSGSIPTSLGRTRSLVSRGELQLDGATADFPFFSGLLQYRQFTGFKPSILLSDNFLSGAIPTQLGNLQNLHVLDLARNNLSGTIPDELSSMQKLETLDLSGNHLTGGIPSSLTKLSFLSTLNVGNNNLTGKIPEGGQFSTFRRGSYEGNPGLCGLPLEACSAEATFTGGRTKQKKTFVFGMAIAVAFGAGFIAALIFFTLGGCWNRRPP